MRHCQPASAVAFFYFDFNNEEKQRHGNLVRSLIVQLSAQSTRTSNALNGLYSCHQDGQQAPTAEKLVETLQEMICNSHQTYIILDALDECTEREELLVLIKDMAEWNLGKLHILATSRREKDIEDALESLVTDQICIQTALVNP